MLRRTLVTAMLLLAALPAAAVGKTFTVDTTADGVDPQPDDRCIVPPHDNCTLRGAVASANATAGPDVIVLGADTYTLSIAPSGSNDVSSGDLDVTDDLTISGAGQDQTIID